MMRPSALLRLEHKLTSALDEYWGATDQLGAAGYTSDADACESAVADVLGCLEDLVDLVTGEKRSEYQRFCASDNGDHVESQLKSEVLLQNLTLAEKAYEGMLKALSKVPSDGEELDEQLANLQALADRLYSSLGRVID